MTLHFLGKAEFLEKPSDARRTFGFCAQRLEENC